ncbi:lipopolysaccharide core heptose(II) kinase RfaY [Helicobacter sp. UBA3407]|nr:lipopolysaccharide core heptose(II) kinase RfaY [Helicobacter sp. UBA3407]
MLRRRKNQKNLVWAEVLESYIIYKYIERTQLSNFWDITPYLKEISNLIVKLHSYGLASNDIWSENFILDSKERLKIIDLSDNGFLSICQANDWLALKRFYGIEAENKSIFYYLISWRNAFRSYLRKLCGKEA